MSELQKLASNVRALSARAPSYMRGVQEASRSLRSAIQLAASTPRGRQKLAGMLQSNGSSFEKIMSSIGAFSAGASDFAAYLASGEGAGGSASGESAVMVGDHGALRETSPGGTSTITRVDPETGNEITWVADSNQNTVEAKARIICKSQEKRTTAEKRAQREVGRSTRNEFNEETGTGYDDGGHLIMHGLIGSNGKVNLVPQNSYLNEHGEWRKMEREIEDLSNKSYEIELTVIPIYSKNNPSRPSLFKVTYKATKPGAQTILYQHRFENRDSRME